MKKFLNFLLICLILSVQAKLDVQLLEKELVTNFSNEKDAQDSIDLTLCLKAIKDKNYLDEIQKLIDAGEFPEGSDLEETALSVCQTLAPNDELRSISKVLVPKVLRGEVPLVSTKTFSKLELVPHDRELDFEPNLRLPRWLKILRAVCKFLADVFTAAVELIDSITQ